MADTIHKHLVQADWSSALAAMSIGALSGPTEPALASLLACENLQPQPPTIAEFLALVGRTGQKSTIPWARLLRLDEEPQIAPGAASSSHESMAISSAGTAMHVANPPQKSPTHRATTNSNVFLPAEHLPANIVRLSSRNRLPKAANNTVKIEPPDRVGPAAGTRSQARRLDLGDNQGS